MLERDVGWIGLPRNTQELKMRRPTWKTVSTLVTTIVIVGCAESAVVAPTESLTAATTIAHVPAGMVIPDMSLTGVRESNSHSGSDSYDYTDEFTLSPAGGFWMIGNVASVYFPVGSACDPNSSYGADQWDVPCLAAKSNIKLTATVHVTKTGGTWIDFDKHIRFVPTKDPSRYVTITMASAGTVGARDVSKFNIYYTPYIGGHGTNEAANDGSMISYVNTFAGSVTRRIKHFSGYTVPGRGTSCTPSGPGDPDCVWVDDGGGALGGDQ